MDKAKDDWNQFSGNGGSWDMTSADGHRWVIRPSETASNYFALFRLAPGMDLPDAATHDVLSVEEEYGYGLFRSPAEAKVMSTLLSRPTGGTDDAATLLKSLGWEENEPHGRRRWWEAGVQGGYASLHLGSDEDARDVSLSFRLAGENLIRTCFLISHSKRSNVVEGPQGASLHAGAWFIKILRDSNHLLEPLTEKDWISFSGGHGIEPLPLTKFTPPVANQFALTYLAARHPDREMMHSILESSMEVKGTDPIEAFDDEVRTAVEIVMGADNPESADLTKVINRDPWLQFLVVAASRGHEEAVRIARTGQPPTAGM